MYSIIIINIFESISKSISSLLLSLKLPLVSALNQLQVDNTILCAFINFLSLHLNVISPSSNLSNNIDPNFETLLSLFSMDYTD